MGQAKPNSEGHSRRRIRVPLPPDVPHRPIGAPEEDLCMLSFNQHRPCSWNSLPLQHQTRILQWPPSVLHSAIRARGMELLQGFHSSGQGWNCESSDDDRGWEVHTGGHCWRARVLVHGVCELRQGVCASAWCGVGCCSSEAESSCWSPSQCLVKLLLCHGILFVDRVVLFWVLLLFCKCGVVHVMSGDDCFITYIELFMYCTLRMEQDASVLCVSCQNLSCVDVLHIFVWYIAIIYVWVLVQQFEFLFSNSYPQG